MSRALSSSAMPPAQPLQLGVEAVIGNTVSSNLTLSSSPNGDVAYAAGAVAVIYNLSEEKQTRFFHGHSTKPISCLRFSPTGRYLAVGESGKDPRVYIFDVASGSLTATLGSLHSYGILAVCFSEADGGRYLMSIGYNNDAQIAVWDWAHRSATPIGVNRCTSKLLSVACLRDSLVFVTAGVRCLKYWTVPQAVIENTGGQPMPLDSRGGTLKRMANSTFVDLGTSSSADYPLYAITCTGYLCAFNSERAMTKSVHLKVPAAYSLTVSTSAVAIGCSDGCIRLFDPVTLEHISTSPRPHNLLSIVTSSTGQPEERAKTDVYPDIVAIRQLDAADGTKMLFSVGSDRSMYSWNIADPKLPKKQRAFLPHSNGVTGVESYQTGFATTGVDGSIRLWSLMERPGTASSITACRVARPSLTLGGVQGSSRPASPQADGGDEVASSVVNQLRTSSSEWLAHIENPAAGAEKLAVESLHSLAMAADCREIAVGDHTGNLFLFELPSLSCKGIVQAHQGEIRSLDYSSGFEDAHLLASGGRDRRIVIYRLKKTASNTTTSVEVLATLDDHSTAIASVAFIGNKLASSSVDHSLSVRSWNEDEGEFQRESQQRLSCTVGELVLHPEHPGKAVYPIRKERRIAVLDTAVAPSGRSEKSGEPALYTDAQCEPVKLHFDNVTGSYVAVGTSDRSVRLHAVDDRLSVSNTCDAVGVGHAEAVTGMIFTEDSSSLISVSSDGCIIRWAVPPAVLSHIRQGNSRASAAAASSDGLRSASAAGGKRVNLLPSWAAQATKVESSFPVLDEASVLDETIDGSDSEDNFWSTHRRARSSTDSHRRFTIDPYDPPLAEDLRPFQDDDFQLDDDSTSETSTDIDCSDDQPQLAVLPNPTLSFGSPVMAKPAPAPAAVDGDGLTKRSAKLDEEVKRARQRLKELGLIPASPIVKQADEPAASQRTNITIEISADENAARPVRKARVPRTPQSECARPSCVASPSDEPLSRNVAHKERSFEVHDKKTSSAALKKARAAFSEFLQHCDTLRQGDASPKQLSMLDEFMHSCKEEIDARVQSESASSSAEPVPKQESYSQMLFDLAHLLKSGSILI